MDPLSITAGAIAVVTLLAQVSAAFARLREECRDIPERLHTLGNDVADLIAISEDLGVIASEPTIASTLKRLVPRLKELGGILLALSETCSKSKIGVVQARHWSRFESRIQALQKHIETHKSHLQIALGVAQLRNFLDVHLDLAELKSHNCAMAGLQFQLQCELKQNTAIVISSLHTNSRMCRRLEKLEDVVTAMQHRLIDSRTTKFDSSDNTGIDERQVRRGDPDPFERDVTFSPRRNAVGLLSKRYHSPCAHACSCTCHTQHWIVTPTFLGRILGQLFIDCSGIPWARSKCNNPNCERSSSPYLDIEYWLPKGVHWSQIVRLYCAFQAQSGPQFQLRMLRRIPDDAPAIAFAMSGNIPRLKDLFKRGLGSPHDVCETRGYSLLRWALYERRYDTCKFLVYEGADPDYGSPLAHNDVLHDSSRARAHGMLLQHEAPARGEEALRLLTRNSNFVDEQDFTKIHRAVLGLTSVDLETAILQNLHDLETMDASGRTPLSWAAARGDVKSLSILLTHNANPNGFDNYEATPLYNAVQTKSSECCRILLEAGAETDPERPTGKRAGTALTTAAGEYDEIESPLIVQALIDGGADLNSTMSGGRTALHQTTRQDHVKIMEMLLTAGADINVISKNQETPLTSAITHNSHRSLKVLLERSSRYKDCPRLKGPNLLGLVATYADLETMQILIGTDHLRLKYDISYSSQDHSKQLRARPDADEQLLTAFEELLAIVNERPTLTVDRDAAHDAGRTQSSFTVTPVAERNYDIPGSWDEKDDESEDEWHDWEEDEAFDNGSTKSFGLDATYERSFQVGCALH